MRSIGICTEPTSARSSTCAPATPRRERLRPGRGGLQLQTAADGAADALGDRLDGGPGDQQRERRRTAPSMELATEIASVGSSGGDGDAGVALEVELAARQLGSVELAPRRAESSRTSAFRDAGGELPVELA